MGNVVGTVTGSGFFDFRFLNPFTKLPNGTYFGSRYGYVQFIFIASVLISLISVVYYNKNTSKLPLQMFYLIITYLCMYYSLSCLLMPNDHERCYILVWLFLLGLIMSTVLSIFGESLFKNVNKFLNKQNGGAHCYKKDEQEGGKGHKHRRDDEMYGGAHCYKKDEQEGGKRHKHRRDDEMYGGAHCYKKDEQEGGKGHKHRRDDEMYGGAHCYKKDEQEGGGGYHKKNSYEEFGGAHCYKKDEQEGGFFKY